MQRTLIFALRVIWSRELRMVLLSKNDLEDRGQLKTRLCRVQLVPVKPRIGILQNVNHYYHIFK
jgi:hypothetical protein